MRISVMGVHLRLTDSLKNYVESHLGHALERYEGWVHTVGVRLSDTNGPKKAPGMRCQVEVALKGLRPVIVRHESDDLYAAIDAATGRTKQCVSRQLSRKTGGKRHPFANGFAPSPVTPRRLSA